MDDGTRSEPGLRVVEFEYGKIGGGRKQYAAHDVAFRRTAAEQGTAGSAALPVLNRCIYDASHPTFVSRSVKKMGHQMFLTGGK